LSPGYHLGDLRVADRDAVGIQNRYPAGATDLNVYEKTPDCLHIQLAVQNFGHRSLPQHRDAHVDKGKPVFIDPLSGNSGPAGSVLIQNNGWNGRRIYRVFASSRRISVRILQRQAEKLRMKLHEGGKRHFLLPCIQVQGGQHQGKCFQVGFGGIDVHLDLAGSGFQNFAVIF